MAGANNGCEIYNMRRQSSCKRNRRAPAIWASISRDGAAHQRTAASATRLLGLFTGSWLQMAAAKTIWSPAGGYADVVARGTLAPASWLAVRQRERNHCMDDKRK